MFQSSAPSSGGGFFGGESSSSSSSSSGFGAMFGGAKPASGSAALLASAQGALGGVAGGAAGAGEQLFGVSTAGLFEGRVCCCTMTKKQRLYAFLACFAAGVFVSLISSVFIWTFNYVGFGICYSFGNILAILSTLFIMGPWSQLKSMFHPNRALATCIYLGALVATLAVAFTLKNGMLVLALVLVQLLALFWYSLSYIPFGRALVTRAVRGCFSSAG
jgi:hypothetical protein